MLLAGCVGKIHEFYYDTTDFYLEKALGSSSWTLPLSHHYHLLTLLCFCAGIILCPMGYGAIYRSAAGHKSNKGQISRIMCQAHVKSKINLFLNWVLKI